MRVVDGALRIDGARPGEDGCVYYRGTGAALPQFKNFEVVLSARTEKAGNSGLFVHASPGPRDGQTSKGIEVQILNTYDKPTGFSGGLQYAQPLPNQGVQDGEWFDMKVRVENKRVQVWLKTARDRDWRLINDWTQADNWTPPPDKPWVGLGSGTIAFQNWKPEDSFVLLKNIWLRELP